MLIQVANQILPQIRREIENALDTYSHHPYRQAFATPELRDRLIAYVLNRVPADNITVAGLPNWQANSAEEVPRLSKQQLQVTITAGIHDLMLENADWINQHIPSQTQANFAPSSWFG
jgi:hypothetical protein